MTRESRSSSGWSLAKVTLRESLPSSETGEQFVEIFSVGERRHFSEFSFRGMSDSHPFSLELVDAGKGLAK
jgi:hypothetical protein